MIGVNRSLKAPIEVPIVDIMKKEEISFCINADAV